MGFDHRIIVVPMRLCAVILFGLCTAAAQTPPEPEITSSQSSVTFSSRSDLVSVPVVVRDSKGRAVGNLKQSDFRLLDNGKPQAIVQFSMQSRAGGSPGGVETGQRQPGENPSGSNVSQGGALASRYIAYVFDDIHMVAGDIAQMRVAAQKHFDTLQPDTRAAIFTTSGRVFLDFTDDRAKLRETLLRIQPGPNALPPRPPDEKDPDPCPPKITVYLANLAVNEQDPAALQSAEGAAQACWGPDPAPPSYGRIASQTVLSAGIADTKNSFDSLGNLVKRLSVMPGLRSIVLISSGFFVTRDLQKDETMLMEAAVHAKVTLNGLDARGRYTSMTREADAQGDAMRELAAGTGGRFFEHDNGFVEGLATLASAPEYSYLLAFSPQNLKLDGKYHTLKVTIVNSKGLDVQARRGYWAPDHAADAAEQSREEIKEAVFSLEETNSIPVDLTSEFFKTSDEAAELTVQYRLDVNGVHFRNAGDRNEDKLTVVTGIFDQNGHYIHGVQRVIDLHLREQTLQKLQTAGLTAHETFDLPPGHYVVRVVVRDSEGAAMSARNATVNIQ